jgi:hypothetical protein
MKQVIIFFLLTGSSFTLLANTTSSSSKNLNIISKSLNVPGSVYAALPVLENSIPDAVVSTIKAKFGDSVYGITSVKSSADQTAYVVRVGDNGIYKTEIINADGSAVQ